MASLKSATYTGTAGVNSVRHSEWMEKLTRLGIACRGVVYFLIGALALLAALGKGGETTNQRGILERVAGQPFGEFALVIIGIGLFAYAIWRMFCAVADSEGEGSDKKGMLKRVAYGVASVIYGGLAITALKLAWGDPAGSGNQETARSWTAKLMDSPGGILLVVLAGIALIGAGLYQMRHGWREAFMQKMKTSRMSASERDWAAHAGRFGYIARGITLSIIGAFVAIAALRHDPGQVRGLEGALDTLAQQPFGPYLLGAVAIGMMGFGIFSLFAARYRTVRH